LPEGTGYTGKSVIKKLKRFIDQAADVERYPYSSRLAVVSDELKRELSIEPTNFCPPFASLKSYFDQCADQDAITRMLWVDLMTYLPDDILVKVDRMSMAVSLETRAPFLDHTLIEYLASVPTSLKLRGWQSKYLLKKVGERLLPPEILQRKKQGFVVPIASWFNYEMRDYLHDILLSSRLTQRGYLNRTILEQLIRSHQNGKQDYSQALWAVLMFELWCRRFLDL
jgi:asparagine synthase (glutamine-hydrolysing)